MEPFIKHTGVVTPMDRVNVDTDQIVPKQFLKRIERTGFGQFLFYDWRYNEAGELNPDFELNRPGYEGATILATGGNFGSGSSREHAAWALMDYGFRCIIAPGFADIFNSNCFQNGILAVVLPEETVRRIIGRAQAGPGYRLTVDLERQRVEEEDGDLISEFEIDAFRRHSMLNGLDDMGLTLQHEGEIDAFEARRGPYGGVLAG